MNQSRSMSWQQNKRKMPDKPMAPFTTDSQMYITVSKSDKNRGRYYYGYDGQWLTWVDPGQLGALLSTLQSDGTKWYFAPGFIDPDVADKLTLQTNTQPSPVPNSNIPNYPNSNPAPTSRAPPPSPQPSQNPQNFQNPYTSAPPAKPQSTPIPLDKLVDALKTLSDQVSDLREILAKTNSQFTEFNAQYRLDLSLKRRRMTDKVDLNHTLPGNFGEGDSTEEENERENLP